ncbi:hypothetical protein [Ignavibacterium sp.]|uniref:hypothetical protein n=1 Tax=Ignavibacterium sp. TaxID=2651167 RepID=UPI00307E5C30
MSKHYFDAEKIYQLTGSEIKANKTFLETFETIDAEYHLTNRILINPKKHQ